MELDSWNIGYTEIRGFKGDINVFFYVGDVNKANQKLIDNDIYD